MTGTRIESFIMRIEVADEDHIRWQIQYCVNDNGLFGISEKQKLFGNGTEEAFVNLYYDGVNGSERSVTLIRKVREAAREAQRKLTQAHINGEIRGDIPGTVFLA